METDNFGLGILQHGEMLGIDHTAQSFWRRQGAHILDIVERLHAFAHRHADVRQIARVLQNRSAALTVWRQLAA